MDNLQLKYHKLSPNLKAETNNVGQVWLEDQLCCYITDSGKLTKSEHCGLTLETVLPSELAENKVITVSYLKTDNLIFIATELHLILVDIEQKQVFNPLVYPSPKIQEACWNPSQKLLVVVDEEKNLQAYVLRPTEQSGYEFFPYLSSSLQKDSPNSIYVGWGDQNTQFRGIKKKVEVITEIPQPHSRPFISWRGNGEMFVVNYWQDNRRFIKVYSDHLDPLYTSEPCNNLLSPVSFRQSGNYIACAATDGEKNRLVIFEKNCRIKSEYSLPESEGEIKSIQCHPELNVLGVHSETDTQSCLNIYLFANDTCYLKQQFNYLSSEEDLIKFSWIHDLNKNSCKLSVLTSKTWHMYSFGVEPYGVYNSLLAVINGCKVMFTDFCKKIIPPPSFTDVLQFERPVNMITFYPSESVYSFKMSNNKTDFYKYESGAFISYNDYKFLESVPFVNNTVSSFKITVNGVNYKIALNEQQELVINDAVVLANVICIYVYRHYLFFTQTVSESYRLYSVRITPEIIVKCTPQSYVSREIEQGAKIISVTDKNELILIMPRGNLEAITCRLMTIDAIENFLSQNQWTDAINAIRRQRVNWNLLIDLNQQRFLDHIKDFIEAVKYTSLMNAIVSEFSTENCLETMYKSWTSADVLVNDKPKISKQKIFISVLKGLVELNPVLNLQSIVTLQIKHCSLETGLWSVLEIFKAKYVNVCKRAVAQILRYKHVKDVICAVYTLCDVDFLKFIYAECSVDPKIFIPEIEELQSLNELEKRFVMNTRGKNFVNATRYLVLMEDKTNTEISSFITKHGTQHEAYVSLVPKQQHFLTVSKLYAEMLSLKAKHIEAGLILERAKLYEEALQRFKTALDWQKVVSLLDAMEVDEGRKRDMLKSLAKDLINRNKAEDAAILLEHYCGDYVAAIEALIQGNHYFKALCIAKKYKNQELIDKFIQPALEKCNDDLYQRISEQGTQFEAYKCRLLLVRETKYKKLVKDLAGYADDDEMENDCNSELGSIITRSSRSLSSAGTRSSSLSSRNRRKLEKKKIDLREGGTFEDIALIRQLYLLIVDILAMSGDCAEVCRSLVTLPHKFAIARSLQQHLASTQKDVLTDIPLIWTPTFLSSEYSTEPKILSVIENRLELDEQFRIPPTIEKSIDDWKLSILN